MKSSKAAGCTLMPLAAHIISTGRCVSKQSGDRFVLPFPQVFMESNKAPDGSLTPLAARNIDTGMGLERMAQILQVRSTLFTILRRLLFAAAWAVGCQGCVPTALQLQWMVCCLHMVSTCLRH